MVKYNCKKCAHAQVCSFRDKATQKANSFEDAMQLSNLVTDLRCKHYVDSDALAIARSVYDD